MKILIRQFLGKNHSWSVFGWGIANALIQQGHDVDIFSTDGIKHLPNNLKANLIGYTDENKNTIVSGKWPDEEYDAQISYTAMKNWPHYLSNGKKNRIGVWCYEWAGKNSLPTGFAKHYRSCDVICPPSNFAKEVFVSSGVPKDMIRVVPHGIDEQLYKQTSIIQLPTNKRFKILANIAQMHLRKNIPGLLSAYGKAFNKNDDVCLILKGKNNNVVAPFEVSLNSCLQDFNRSFPNHAEVKVYDQFINDMSALYRSIDAVFSMSNAECFLFPALEGIAAGKVILAPNWGGQIDFLNDTNSLLINGKETKANPKSMYWECKNNAIWFEPSIDDATNKLRFAYNNFAALNEKVEAQKESIHKEYSWKNIAKQFVGLIK